MSKLMLDSAQVHRFSNRVALALFPASKETVYLNADQARELGEALIACAKDIMTHDGVNSAFSTVRIGK